MDILDDGGCFGDGDVQIDLDDWGKALKIAFERKLSSENPVRPKSAATGRKLTSDKSPTRP